MRDRRGGFVLVSVLMVVALLAGVVGALSVAARQSIATARLAREALTVELLAEAGAALAGHQLFVEGRPVADVHGQVIAFDAGTVGIVVQGEGGRVDLNGADASALAELWRRAGLSGLPAQTFADRVVDWRDGDGERSPRGAEAAEYAAAGVPLMLANREFRLPSELRFVLGVAEADVAALLPFVTVRAAQGGGADGALEGASDGADLDEDEPSEEVPPSTGAADNAVVLEVRVEGGERAPALWRVVLAPAASEGGRPFQVVGWEALGAGEGASR